MIDKSPVAIRLVFHPSCLNQHDERGQVRYSLQTFLILFDILDIDDFRWGKQNRYTAYLVDLFQEASECWQAGHGTWRLNLEESKIQNSHGSSEGKEPKLSP